jgi:hypothetical protein
MGGGLMQLVAYGAQDIYLTGNPQITFFKVVYRRHTNFSMETIQQTINGAQTTAGSTGTVTISRNGDLVSSVYVSSATAGVQQGSKIISQVECEIGGQLIDRQYEEWNDIWNELSTPASKTTGLKCMICDIGTSGGSDDHAGVGLVQVPLNFWFCRNPGLALPLIALQYHEVKLKFKWGTAANVGVEATCQVWCDYIYLDTDERRRFAQVSHEYLIEQIQKQSATATTSTKLNFNHPVKEIIWSSATVNAYTNARLVLNGHDRFANQEEEYFQLRQPYQYHTAIPHQNLPTVAKHHGAAQSHFVNLFTGTNLDQSAAWEGMDFADSAVATGDVIVSQGGLGGDLDGRTAAATAGEAETNLTLIYSFLTTDLGVTPVVGDEVIVTVDGTVSISGADGTSEVVHASVIAVHAGALAGGLTNAANTHIQFSELLVESTVGAEIDGADDFSIHDFKIASAEMASTSKMTKRINVYSFALKPEEHQPSGTCNFSRIDNAQLRTGAALTTADNIYAVNYNVLRIMSGMGGLAYSN